MIGIIVALSSEVNNLLTKVDKLKKIKLADKQCYSARYKNNKLIIAVSGIGKVNAALTTQLLIDKFNPSSILNFGTCGGMNDSVNVLNYYSIEKCCQYDFDLSELDNVPVGYIQDYDRVHFPADIKPLSFLYSTNIASADKFTNKTSDIKTINDMGCSLCDMEAGAIAQVCLSNSVPLYVIKGVTDVYGSGTAPQQFLQNLQKVSEGFVDVISRQLTT